MRYPICFHSFHVQNAGSNAVLMKRRRRIVSSHTIRLSVVHVVELDGVMECAVRIAMVQVRPFSKETTKIRMLI